MHLTLINICIDKTKLYQIFQWPNQNSSPHTSGPGSVAGVADPCSLVYVKCKCTTLGFTILRKLILCKFHKEYYHKGNCPLFIIDNTTLTVGPEIFIFVCYVKHKFTQAEYLVYTGDEPNRKIKKTCIYP